MIVRLTRSARLMGTALLLGMLLAIALHSQAQAFDRGWTHITATGANHVLFYNAQSGLGVSGYFDSQADYHQQQVNPNFATGWTDIAGAGNGLLLFYNANTGYGVTGEVDPNGNYSDHNSYQFATGWTHIVGFANGAILFYNRSSGVAASGYIDSAGNWIQTNVYNFASDWQHITASGNKVSFLRESVWCGERATGYFDEWGNFHWQTSTNGCSRGTASAAGVGDGFFMFYRKADGYGDFRIMGQDGTLTSLGDYHFSPGWTHLVGFANGTLFFYNTDSGTSASGYVDLFGFTQTHSWS